MAKECILLLVSNCCLRKQVDNEGEILTCYFICNCSGDRKDGFINISEQPELELNLPIPVSSL